ncbi:MAG: diaminopimelate epimerase [Planctomycetota bacterium]|nr:MAG: diaminopimelate epimerase [Planctomycetota bacterium]
MQFTKMHGIGNDYVYVDCFAETFPSDPGALARQMADRHFGVGGDGVIFICPSEVASARMRMFNADGSEAEMCGNGIRCVAKYVYDHGIAREPHLKIETGAGVLALDLETADGKVSRVRVNMGQPILAPDKIPVALAAFSQDRVVDVPLDAYVELPNADGWIDTSGLDPRMTCVSMGNPHAVLYCKSTSAVPLETIGPQLETAPIFPARMNVHFVEIRSPGEVTMCTWERGSGVTLACGTGASAVCVAGSLSERTESKILAHLPGGDLELEWALDGSVYMTGPATEVFHGQWP